MAVVPSSKKILIIDDEEPIVELISEILRKYSYEPIAVTRWTDALDAINHESPDVILLDLKMPTITGSSMLEFLREEGITVPVIIVSGFVTDEVARELSMHGISGIVKKPFQAAQLKTEIERALAAEPPSPPTEQFPRTAPASDEARTPAAPSDSTVNNLYDRPPEPAPEPVSPPEPVSAPEPAPKPISPPGPVSAPGPAPEPMPAPDSDTIPTMDILYSLPSDEASSAPPSSDRSPTEEEALQILQKLNPDAVPGGVHRQGDSPPNIPPPPADAEDALQALQNFTPAVPQSGQPDRQGIPPPGTPAADNSRGGALQVPQEPGVAPPSEQLDKPGVPPSGPSTIDNLSQNIPQKTDAPPVPPPPSGMPAEPGEASDQKLMSLDNPLYEGGHAPELPPLQKSADPFTATNRPHLGGIVRAA